jgi:hypothetical protein
MNNEDRDFPDQTNCLPTVSIGVRIMPSHREGIIKYELGRFKTDAVIEFVRTVLFFSPCPAQISPPCSYIIVATIPCCQQIIGKSKRLRHGLMAETVIAALEDCEDYQAFEAAVISDYDAASAVERELVLRLASVLWRLRRATGIETAIFESVTAEPGKIERGHSRPALVETADLSDRDQIHLVATRQSDAAAGNELSFDAKTIMATASCAWPLCRLSPLTASAVTSICAGGKRDRSCLRWGRCGAASDSRAAQSFHFRSADASPAPCLKSVQVTDHSRGQQ